MNHKTHRKPTKATKMVPCQFVLPLRAMFSIVGWELLARKLAYLVSQLWALLEDCCCRPGVLEAAGLAGWLGAACQKVSVV